MLKSILKKDIIFKTIFVRMQLLKKIFNFYIFSNIHVALASASLTKLTLLYWNIDDNKAPLFVLFSTILSYNYIRLTRIKQIDYWFASWLKSNKKYLIIISAFSLFGCIYLVFKIYLSAFFVLLPFSLLTGFYVLPKSLSKKINIRSLPAFKIFAIALSWAGVTVIFPLMQYHLFDTKIVWLFISRFLFVVALTLPFDIRDVPYDSKSLKTIPIWIGVLNSKILGIIFILLFLMIHLFILQISVNWIEVVVATVLGALLLKATTNQSKYYSAFWVEGIPILWLCLYLIFI